MLALDRDVLQGFAARNMGSVAQVQSTVASRLTPTLVERRSRLEDAQRALRI